MATAQNVAYQDGVCILVLSLALCLHIRDKGKKTLKWTGVQSSSSVTLQNDQGFVKFAWTSHFITVSSIMMIFVLCSIFF